MHTALAFAPATVANVGPGFDVLGFALGDFGDHVRATRSESSGLRLTVSGEGAGQVPADVVRNTAGIAARAVLDAAGADIGVELHLTKGLPVGSGLGSSAASAAAGATAVNALLGSPLSPLELVPPCVEAEAAVSGRHADNVAPALLGGLVLVRALDPLDVVRVPVPAGLRVAVVTPEFTLSTSRAREVLPASVPLASMVRTTANVAALVAACYAGDLALLGRSLEDVVVTPVRAALIPGATAALEAARAAGALGASVSGAGPSVFALTAGADVSGPMVAAFAAAGLAATVHLGPVATDGARCV